jgi:nucleoside-diphosphate-sugar epimerase
MDKSKVLVIGGAGYLGSVITGQLLGQGYDVRVLDAFLFGNESLGSLKDHSRLQIVQGDMRDVRLLTDCLKDTQAVILLAALVGEKACDRDPDETLSVNASGTLNVAQACAHAGIRRFIFASTDSAYGIQEGVMTEESALNPISLYAKLKADAEKGILALADGHFAPCVLRMATLYGLSPRMRLDLIINIFTLHAVARNEINIFGGQQWRPLVHVQDAARAYLKVLKAPLETTSGEIFNVGSNEQNYKIGELGKLVGRVFPDLKIKTIMQSPDLRDYHVNFDKIRSRLGYEVQISVEEGIREMKKSLEENHIPDYEYSRYCNA